MAHKEQHDVWNQYGYIANHYCDGTTSLAGPGISWQYFVDRSWETLPHSLKWYKQTGSALPSNPYTVVRVRRVHPSGGLYYNCGPPCGWPVGRVASSVGVFTGYENLDPYVPSNDTVTRISQLATNDAIQKAYNVDRTIVEDVAERRKTYSSVARTISRIGGAIRDLRHGNVSGALSHLGNPKGRRPVFRDVGSTWLALRYGWVPLLDDIYTTVQRWKPIDSHPVLRVVGNSKEPLSLGGSGIPYPDLSKLLSYSLKGSWSARCKLRYSIIDSTFLNIAQTDLANPLLIAWELLPFSFIADWFLPVSEYFQRLSAIQGLSFLNGEVTLKLESDWHKKFEFRQIDCSHVSGEYSYFIYYFKFSRSPITIEPTVFWRIKNPFSNLRHIPDALALLQQALRGSEHWSRYT